MTIPVQVGGVELLVEATSVAGSQPTSKLEDATDYVKDAFVRAQEAIVEVAASTVEVMGAAARRAAAPESVEVEFGLKFSAQGNVILAGAAGEATLKVKLTYERPVSGEK